MMTMMSMFIIYSWGEHLQEAEDGIWDRVGWSGGRWGVTLYFLSIVKFSFAGCIRRCGGLPDVRGMETQEYPEWTVEGIN